MRSGLFAITLDLLAGLSFYFVKSSVFLVQLESEINFIEIESELNFTAQSFEGVTPGWAMATEGRSRDRSRMSGDTLAPDWEENRNSSRCHSTHTKYSLCWCPAASLLQLSTSLVQDSWLYPEYAK